MTTTKKALLLFTSAIMVSLLIGLAMAQNVSVTCDPEIIRLPGGSTTITVTSDKGAIGLMTVFQPNGDSSTVPIHVRAGGSVSKDYPDDFPGGSTMQLGEYTVRVALLGLIWVRVFRVTFTVIPELPLGALMATTTSLTALIGIVAVKHLRTKHQLE